MDMILGARSSTHSNVQIRHTGCAAIEKRTTEEENRSCLGISYVGKRCSLVCCVELLIRELAVAFQGCRPLKHDEARIRPANMKADEGGRTPDCAISSSTRTER